MRPNLRSSNLIVALSGCIGRDADFVGAGVETTGVSGALPISFSRLSEISDAISCALSLCGLGCGAACGRPP